jgi:hypothetical protein
MLLGKAVIAGPKGFKKGAEITEEVLETLSAAQWWQLALGDEKDAGQVEAAARAVRRFQEAPRTAASMDKVEKVQRGDEMPPGVMKMVKVFVAVKRKIQPGDKMAGRHGNKGVVSRSCRWRTCRSWKTERPVDFVLNPLGVPSPDECRPDPRDPPGLGRARSWASRSARCWTPIAARRHDKPVRDALEDRLSRRGRNERVRGMDDDQ